MNHQFREGQRVRVIDAAFYIGGVHPHAGRLADVVDLGSSKDEMPKGRVPIVFVSSSTIGFVWWEIPENLELVP